MRWSKVKQLVEERFADSLHGRVAVHSTRYHNDRWQEDSRGWFTIDKREVANYSSLIYPRAGEMEDPDRNLSEKGEFERALGTFLSLSSDDAVCSDTPLIRALAMLDRRIGKRRLRALQLHEAEHPLVKQFYKLRCEAEGITLPATVS